MPHQEPLRTGSEAGGAMQQRRGGARTRATACRGTTSTEYTARSISASASRLHRTCTVMRRTLQPCARASGGQGQRAGTRGAPRLTLNTRWISSAAPRCTRPSAVARRRPASMVRATKPRTVAANMLRTS